jgi:hypothetical protein
MSSEFEHEPVRGLPARVPPGEQILWQGAPDPWLLARHALHLRKFAVYFALLVIWRIVTAFSDGLSPGAATFAIASSLVLSLAALGLIAGLAWLMSRTTVYTITNRRVVMRFGVALPLSFNIPFRIVQAAELKSTADGGGDISLSLSGPDRMSYLVLWPHARAWQLASPQPTLRALRGANQVAELLGQALATSTFDNESTAAPAASSVRATADTGAVVAA